MKRKGIMKRVLLFVGLKAIEIVPFILVPFVMGWLLRLVFPIGYDFLSLSPEGPSVWHTWIAGMLIVLFTVGVLLGVLLLGALIAIMIEQNWEKAGDLMKPKEEKPEIITPDFKQPTICVWCKAEIYVMPNWGHPYYMSCPKCKKTIWITTDKLITLRGENIMAVGK